VPRNPSDSSPSADRVVVSVNPKAGARSSQDRVDRLAELLHQQGVQATVLTSLDEVAEQANRWHAEGKLRALVGVGGDGTAAELVNRTTEGLPLTLLPSGNENLLARHLNLSADPDELCRTIVDGAVCRLDAARANDRVFLLMLGCGFDADVVDRVHQRRTGHIRSRNYVKPTLESIRSYEYPEIQVRWDPPDEDSDAPADEPAACSTVARWVFAFNMPCYGGGLRLAPWADGSDGMLDLCTFQRGALLHGLKYAGAVMLGRHRQLADFATRRVRRLTITAESEVPYQLDGDPGGTLPVEVEVLPGRLAMVVPVSTKELFTKETTNP